MGYRIKKPFWIYNKRTKRFENQWFEYPIQALKFIENRLGNSNNFKIIDKRKIKNKKQWRQKNFKL